VYLVEGGDDVGVVDVLLGGVSLEPLEEDLVSGEALDGQDEVVAQVHLGLAGLDELDEGRLLLQLGEHGHLDSHTQPSPAQPT
jgi:hypothetical protein